LISGRTGILGVIGDPVQHTASPVMHNAALGATDLDYAYVAFHVAADQVRTVPAAMRALQIRGLNVTVPHKVSIMAGLDEISDEARVIGAVNTISNDDGHLTGHNTDAYGVAASLEHDGGLRTFPAKVVLLGAGGAARAILYVVLQRPEVEEVALLNRSAGRAQQLAEDLDPEGKRVRVGGLEDCDQVGDAGLLINTTSVGMEPEEDKSPLADETCLHGGLVVLDIVYRPLRTRLLAQAEAAGARVVEGLGMFVHQGARAFEIWTGEKAPVDVMRRALTGAQR
jgi:shikimate dehydrogenase